MLLTGVQTCALTISRGQVRADPQPRAAGRARALPQDGGRDAARAEGSTQEPAPGRRKPGVLDQGGQHRADASAGSGGRPAARGPEKKKGMNARTAAVLVVLLAVIGGGALLYYQQERSPSPANVGPLGQPPLKGLKVSEGASIRILEPQEMPRGGGPAGPFGGAPRRSEDGAHRLRPPQAGQRDERRLARSPLVQGRKAQEPRGALRRRQPLAHRAPRRQCRVEAGRCQARG